MRRLYTAGCRAPYLPVTQPITSIRTALRWRSRGLTTLPDQIPPTSSAPTPLWSRQWIRRGVGLGLGLAALAGFTFAAYTSSWDIGDRERWLVARMGANQLVRALKWSHPAVLPHVLPALAHLSSSAEGANELAAHQVLPVLCDIGLSADPHVRFYSVMIISNLVRADQRVLAQLPVADLKRYIEGLIQAEKGHGGPYSSSVQISIIRLLTEILNAKEPALGTIQDLDYSVFLNVASPWSDSAQVTESEDEDYQAFYQSLAKCLAQTSTIPDNREGVALKGGLQLLYLTVKRSSKFKAEIIEDAARCIANLAVNEKLSSAVVTEGGLEILNLAREAGFVTHQVCRAVANLAKSELHKGSLVSLGWLRDIRAWLTSPDVDIKTISLAALANLASPAVNGIDFVNEISSQVGLEPLKHLINDVSATFSSLSERKRWSFSEMLLRAIANLVVHDDFAEELSKVVAERGVLSLLPQPQAPAGYEPAIKALREATRVFANMAAHQRLAPIIIQQKKELLELSLIEDPITKQQTSRALANLAVYRAQELQEDTRIEALLYSWLQSTDPTVKSNAVRAMASITFTTLSGAKYVEGVHLLYPGQDTLTDAAKAKKFSLEHKHDIVFLHGVTGHPFTTWASGNGIEDDQAEGFECWPREWLPEDLPGGRIISIAFDLYLSGWFGEGEPASAYASRILNQLKQAAVGTKPVIFVAHSFGGLIVKELLRQAEQDPKLRRLRDNTVGVVFYSTPHLGVEHVAWSFPQLHYLLFRANPVLDDLHIGSGQLMELNKHFATSGAHISTLSFGEEITCFGSRFSCYHVVPDESANPHLSLLRKKLAGNQLNSELLDELAEESLEPAHTAEEIAQVFADDAECGVRDEFYRTQADHLQVCKPPTREDPRYRLTLAFMRYVLRCRRPPTSLWSSFGY